MISTNNCTTSKKDDPAPATSTTSGTTSKTVPGGTTSTSVATAPKASSTASSKPTTAPAVKSTATTTVAGKAAPTETRTVRTINTVGAKPTAGKFTPKKGSSSVKAKGKVTLVRSTKSAKAEDALSGWFAAAFGLTTFKDTISFDIDTQSNELIATAYKDSGATLLSDKSAVWFDVTKSSAFKDISNLQVFFFDDGSYWAYNGKEWNSGTWYIDENGEYLGIDLGTQDEAVFDIVAGSDDGTLLTLGLAQEKTYIFLVLGQLSY
ncbi:MAG: hypothetical protein SFY32_00405 [Bacteroidota bacterium]|nr:hypothetical protein [Bacteroidota bacterium]